MNHRSDSIAADASLNEFQRLMRCWAELAPYNAGIMARISGPADIERWRQAAHAVSEETIIPGRAKANPPGQTEIENAGASLAETIRCQLNRRFPPEELPFRFFVVNHSPDSHWFGIMFDHWITDGHSGRQFLRRCVLRYQQPASTISPSLPPLHPLEKDAVPLLAFHTGLRALPRGFAECVRQYQRHRRAYRMWLSDPADLSSGFLYHDLSGISVRHLRSRARECKASLNDLFLAAIAQTLGKHTAAERSAGKRRGLFRTPRDQVALATAVDLRRLMKYPLEDTMGCFVTYYTSLLSNPETQPLETLARHIARETRSKKSPTSAMRSFSSMQPFRMHWDYWPGDRKQIFHKGFPLLAGLSYLNLTDSSVEQEATSVPQVLGYLGISPTGPMLPMVFMLMTFGDRLSLGLTYRTAAFTAESAALIAEQFADRLR
jgi:hypothetical protein